MGKSNWLKVSALLMFLVQGQGFAEVATKVSLFPVKQHSFEWLLSDHEGSKLIKSGYACKQCHDGTKDDSLAKNTLPVKVTFATESQKSLVTLEWQSQAKQADVSLMMDGGQVSVFEKTGCWASCHEDMKGMPQDQGLTKYLGASRVKLKRSGGGTNYKPDTELAHLKDQGQYLELWKATVLGNKLDRVEQFSVLAKLESVNPSNLTGRFSREGDRWKLTIEQAQAEKDKSWFKDGQYTLGLAVHQDSEGLEHWVSLPIKLTVKDGKFTVE